jgi:hypothetical protein
MVSAPIALWKLRCIIRLADYQSLHGPTDSAEEAYICTRLLAPSKL